MSCPLRSSGSHLDSGALFALSLFLAVIVPCVWVLLRSLLSWIFREMSISVGAMLGLTVDTCSATVKLVASDVFHTFSTLLRTRILQRSFSIRFEWRSVPSRRFWLQSCSSQFALGNLEVLSTSFTWLRCVIRDSFFFFRSTCVSHRCQGAGSTHETDSGFAGTHAN